MAQTDSPNRTTKGSMTDDLPYWASFSFCRSLGSVRMRKICTHFKTMKAAWDAPINEFRALGFENTVLDEIMAKRHELDPEKVWQGVCKEGLTLVPFTDPRYPVLLKEIYDPPALLYARGALTSGERDVRIAVVGTRKMTPYGEQVTEMLVRPLAENGITVISGLAYGVDALAHETTLRSGGATIAVLGCGLDRATIYPRHHIRLADRIAEAGGCVLSEFAPRTPPLKHHFPFRNRIIAGLSRAVLVVEAPQGSGAITTANYALEFNRDVMAVPGNITAPNAWGPHELLKKGAVPVTEAGDIFKHLSIENPRAALDTKKSLPNTEEELKILKMLARDAPVHIDELAKQAALSSSAVAGALTLMEMKGMVKNMGGMRYIKL